MISVSTEGSQGPRHMCQHPARRAALRAPRLPPHAASRAARAPRPRPGRLHPVAPRAPAASWSRASVRTAAGMLRAGGGGGGARVGARLGPPAAVAFGERGLDGGTRAGPGRADWSALSRGATAVPPTRLSGRCLPRAPARLAFPQWRRRRQRRQRRAAPLQAARGSGGGASWRSRAAACAGRAAPTLAPHCRARAREEGEGRPRSGRDRGSWQRLRGFVFFD